MSPIEVVGWLGTLCFFGRHLSQWLQSERAGRSVTPRSFWVVSLAGSFLLGAYCLVRGEPILFVGNAVNGAIYARNLVLSARAREPRTTGVFWMSLTAAVALGLVLAAAFSDLGSRNTDSRLWHVCAGVGQAAWSGRFVLQWWLSERRGESHLPATFWWLSLFGNALLLGYALHLSDRVLVASYLLGPIVQVRNLVLLGRAKRRDAEGRTDLLPRAPKAPQDPSIGGSKDPAAGEGGPSGSPACAKGFPLPAPERPPEPAAAGSRSSSS